MSLKLSLSLFLGTLVTTTASAAENPWVVYPGGEGAGSGKHIVLVSGDEEYRSEEALPQLGKILSRHHGFRCTVLFAIDPKSGLINPNVSNNIPGLEALQSADLLIIFTRFRRLPDKQMAHIDAYLKTGKPVIGIRTSTHAFNFGGRGAFAHYGNGYNGGLKPWKDGFGRLILGEKWISHHGGHKSESTHGLVAPKARQHPITRGLKDGDVWGPTDVYGVRLPLPDDSHPIILGQVMKRKGPRDNNDPFYGLRPDDGPPVSGRKNNPLMPVAWTKTFQVPGGKPGRAFMSTIGASTDLVAEGTRRLLVNATFWSLKMEKAIPATGSKVDLVGKFAPTRYEFRRGNYWIDRKMSPGEHRLGAAGE